jgi:S-DNA-T family DNA segregation ATPase FtsK/SpoIIIE
MGTTNVGLGGRIRGSRTPQLVMIQPRPSLTLALAKNLGLVSRVAVAWSVRHPATLAALLTAALVAAVAGTLGLVLLAVAAVAGLVLWSRRWPSSFRRQVVSRWRGFWIYRRSWQPSMVTCGLALTVGEREYLPQIRRVASTACEDRLLVELLSGQAPEDFEGRTSQLAHTFEALRCRVVVDRPGRISLVFTHRDPLSDLVDAIEPETTPDLEALALGRRADGEPWSLRLVGMHVLIAGATGAGKGSVLWSLIRALGPAVRDGWVQLWAVDPKGGMELSPGAGLFARFAYGDPVVIVELLEEAVAFMRTRAERLRQTGERVHTPTVADPLVVVVIDEMAALTAYVGDRELKKRAEAALQLLLSQGRAPGVLVVAALQDPGKDVLPFRDLFPSRIALRLLEDTQIDMVLGRSARLHGAECDQIPASLPGVGYVALEGVREPVRVRAAYVTDDELSRMVSDYTPASVSASPALRLVDQKAGSR